MSVGLRIKYGRDKRWGKFLGRILLSMTAGEEALAG